VIGRAGPELMLGDRESEFSHGSRLAPGTAYARRAAAVGKPLRRPFQIAKIAG